MNYKITNTTKNETNIVIDVEISEEEVNSNEDKAIEMFSNRIEMQGFRKGHIPKEIIKEKVSQMELMYEMAQIAISKNYSKIILETKIEVVGSPEINIKKIAKGSPLELSIKIDFLPEIKLPDIAKIREVNKLGEVPESTEDEIRTIYEEIKTNYEKEGKTEEEMLAFFKIDSVETLKENINKNLKYEKQIDEKSKRRAMIMEEIISKTEIKLPKSMVEFELDYLVSDMKSRIKSMGMDYDVYLKSMKKTADEARLELTSDAEKRAKMELILREVAKENKLEIDAHKLSHILEDLKKMYPTWKENEVEFYAKSIAEKEAAMMFVAGEKEEPHNHSH